MDQTVSRQNLRKILSQSYLLVNRDVLKEHGTDFAIWLAYMLYKADYFEEHGMMDKDGFFYNIQPDIERETRLNIHRQGRVVDKLKEWGALEVVAKGLPRKYYYRFNYHRLVEVIFEKPNHNKTEGVLVNDCNEYSDQAVSVKIPNKELLNKDNLPSEDIAFSHANAEHLPSREAYKGSFKPKEKLTRIRRSNKVIDDLMLYWTNMGLRQSKVGSNVYNENVTSLRKLLNGSFFKDTIYKVIARPFTEDEIKLAMKRFSMAALDPDYEPGNPMLKRRMKGYAIASFIYNPLATAEKSWFLQFVKSAPAKMGQTMRLKKIPEKHMSKLNPIRDVFKHFYLKKVRGDLKIELSPQDENNFTDGALRLYNFASSNARKLDGVSDLALARLACKSIWDWARGDPSSITSAKFKSDHTFNSLLPSYLIKIGSVRGE